jgi:EAL domain-containing protein (putative c-di-GMP-specific phosphodiesterase class I)
VTQKILSFLESPFLIDDQELHITASIGVSFYPNDGMDAETLLKNADTAMYRAKEQGRNHYQLYTSSMNAKAFEHIVIEKGIRRAIAQNEFRVYYQPQVDLYSGQIIGVEALVRWQHPDLGLVSPSNFIPIAEESGLIIQIGEMIMRTACAQNKAWQDAGLPPIRMAINFSARQFQDLNLATRVKQVLLDTGLDPSYLEIEITESVMMKDENTAIQTLRQLRNSGVHISIDDFGTGYSSLSHLKRFPVEKIKIDASFIREITTDNDDAAITTAIIAMAHSLNLKAIAEGVENVDQLRFLRSLKCDAMQGFLFSPALPADDVTKLLFEERHFL